MREYVAKIGGRYTYIEDFIGLQELSLAVATIFDGCKNFIVSGCRTSGPNSSLNIAPGYVYINGRIRYFEGNVVDLSKPYYIVEKDVAYNVPYAQNATQQGYIDYGCEGTDTIPIDRQYIEITSSYIPRLKDEFFGKYAVTLDSSFAQQTITQNLVMRNDLRVMGELVNDSGIYVKNPEKQVELEEKIGADGSGHIAYKKEGRELSKLLFGFDGVTKFISGGIEQLAISPNNIAIDRLMTNETRTSSLVMTGSDLYNYADSSETGSVDINKMGHNGGTTRSRNFNVYNGRKQLLFRSDGSMNQNYSYCTLNEESASGCGLSLKDTAHKYNSVSYIKYMEWKDMDGVVLGSVGYSDSGSTDLIIKNEHGNIRLIGKSIKIDGSFQEGGSTLDTKYATVKYVDEGLGKKVDAVSGKQLSDENFTAALKQKLEGLSTDGLAQGDDVTSAIGTALIKTNNLSDLQNKSTARDNLEVYSKSDVNSKFLKSDLSNVVTLTNEQKAQFRNAIGAGASSIDGYKSQIQGWVREEVKQIRENELDKAYAPKSFSNMVSQTEGSMRFYKIGNVVTGGGILQPSDIGDSKPIVVIPDIIGAPVTDIGGSVFTGFNGSEDINYGFRWYCSAGSRNVMCVQQHNTHKFGKPIYFSFTYVTNKFA